MTIAAGYGIGAGTWRHEARALMGLSGPLVLTNLGQIAIQTTDVVMIGWLGAEPLAASALGTSTILLLLMFGIGLTIATAPMIAQDLGRNRFAVREPRRTVRQGMWAIAAFAVPASLILWWVDPILRTLGQDPALAAAAESYVRAAMWGLAPALWFIGLRNFINGLERPRAGMVIMFIGIGFNAIADYALIFGKFGMPELGLRGAGIATTLTNLFLWIALQGFIEVDRRLRRYHLLGRLWRPDWVRFREVFKLGVPIALTLEFEVGLFVASTYLMGLIGTFELAAHQIALQVASVTFMVPLGLGQAATVRVGRAVGRIDPAGVRRAGTLALLLGSLFMLAMAAVMVAIPAQLVGIFIDTSAPENARLVELGASFLLMAALFQVFDGGQVIGLGALRGLKDTRLPMVFAGICYWLVGIGLAVGLAFGLGLGGIGIWLGLAAGLAVAAVLMIWRFARIQQGFQAQHPLTAVPSPS